MSPMTMTEKILARGELIPEDWLIAGTTGYGFLNTVNGLFVDASNEDAIRSLYALATGQTTSCEDMPLEVSAWYAARSPASSGCSRCGLGDRPLRSAPGFHDGNARRSPRSSLPIYRTYINSSGFSAVDRQTVDLAIDRARRGNPVIADSRSSSCEASSWPATATPA